MGFALIYGADIRRLGWLAKLTKTLDNSKPSEVCREDWTRMRSSMMMDDYDDDDDDELVG